MSKKAKKYIYLNVVQGKFGFHGWEDLTSPEDYREARDDLKAYRLNQPGYPYRIISRRVINGKWGCKKCNLPWDDQGVCPNVHICPECGLEYIHNADMTKKCQYCIFSLKRKGEKQIVNVKKYK